MRHYQRGIATTVILIIFLLSGIAIASAYFVFFQKQQKAAVNSFEDCAQYYPVLESYPEQCNTPEGRHFVKELSEEQKKKLEPLQETPMIPKIDKETGWIIYEDINFHVYSLSYPPDWTFLAKSEGCGPVFTPVKESQWFNSSWLTICGYSGESADKLSKQYISPGDKVLRQEESTLDGRSAKRVDLQNDYEYASYFFVDTKPGKSENVTLVITIDNREGKYPSKYIKQFEDVISTFKFL